MESSVPGSLIKRSGRSDEAAAAAIKKPHTTVHNHNPTDEIKTDCKHGIAIYSTRATPEAGVPDQILPTKWKPDNDNIQLTSNIETENSTAEGTNLLPADLTRSKTALSSPVDPGYARILSSTALDTNSRVSDEDVESILGDWDRKYRRKNSGRIRNLHDPQDSDHEDVLSPGPATAPENVIYNRKPSDSNPDDEYRRIFRRHNFDFNDPAPVKESLCHVCGRWKPVIQHRKYRQICNGCRLAFSTKQPFHTTCGSCFAAKPVHDVEVINGHSRCSDCRAAGFHKRTNRAFSDQHADQRDDVHGDGIVLTPREERQRRPSRPPGFVDSKSILKDLRKPVNARRAAPKRKLVQEEDVALYDAIAQRDMIMRKRRTMMESADTESSSISGYSEAPMKSNSQLIRLGIRTASNGPPIWIKVSRSAPLEKMFMAALQSDDALRGYVFMLPGRYVHMDDTPNELGLTDDDCFEMHKLPRVWLPDARSIANADSAEVSSIDTPSVTRKAPRKAELPNDSNPIHFGEMHNSKPNEARKPTKIAYDVELPKPIDTNALSSEFDMQFSSSSSSVTSNLGLPKLAREDQAEILAILTSDKESTPSHTSGSQNRYSPRLQREPKPQSLHTCQGAWVPTSRSPSVISLHAPKEDVPSEDNFEPRDDAAILESLLLQYPPSEENAKLSKQREAQQEVIELEDWD